MAQNQAIKEKFIEILKIVHVGDSPFLTDVIPYQERVEGMPVLMYLYRPHRQGQFSTSGLPDIGLARETGVSEFTYSWRWELFVPLNAGVNVALEQYEEFDVNMGLLFASNTRLGGLAEELSVGPREDPTLRAEDNRRYLYVPYDFAATAQEEV